MLIIHYHVSFCRIFDVFLLFFYIRILYEHFEVSYD